jgi:hypothetical protein
MGMDVSGVNPVSETGSYFRNNVWWWRPLWNYCYHVAPDLITDDVFESGSYNDGAGLNAKGAAKLAVILETKIAEGHTKIWQKERELYLESLPDDNCGVCNNNNRGYSKKKDCKGCDGKGTRDSWEKSYPFYVENVENFAKFLIDSGGFEIW